jgi:hypothetical protein
VPTQKRGATMQKVKKKRIEFQYPENELSDVRDFLDNKRLALTSIKFLKSGSFIPLPFEMYRTVIDILPESKIPMLANAQREIIEESPNLTNLFTRIIAWCIHLKKTPRNEKFYAIFQECNNKLEFMWIHNLGISNNNFSRSFYQGLIESSLVNDWNVIDNSLNISNLSIIFEHR